MSTFKVRDNAPPRRIGRALHGLVSQSANLKPGDTLTLADVIPLARVMKLLQIGTFEGKPPSIVTQPDGQPQPTIWLQIGEETNLGTLQILLLGVTAIGRLARGHRMLVVQCPALDEAREALAGHGCMLANQ